MSDEGQGQDIIIADEEALRRAIAENDANVDRDVRRYSRRGFVT